MVLQSALYIGFYVYGHVRGRETDEDELQLPKLLLGTTAQICDSSTHEA